MFFLTPVVDIKVKNFFIFILKLFRNLNLKKANEYDYVYSLQLYVKIS